MKATKALKIRSHQQYDAEGRLRVRSRPERGTDMMTWKCPALNCNHDSLYFANIKDHMRDAHPQATCEICGKEIEWRYLIRHVRRHIEYCDREKAMKCQLCNVGFWTYEDHRLHFDFPFHQEKLMETKGKASNCLSQL